MATSGRINTGGCNSSNFYLKWQLSGQSEDGNYSNINWQAGINIGGGAWWGTNAVRLNSVYINGSGNLGSGTWSGISGNGDHDLRSGSIRINHNGDGGKSFGASVSGWLYSCGDYGTSGSWALPGLYQEIGINSVQIQDVTDVSFNVYVSVNRTANLLQLSVDGGGWTTYRSSNYSSATVQVGSADNPLTSGDDHTVRVRVRRNSNGNITDSGTYSLTTLSQNNFFDLGDM